MTKFIVKVKDLTRPVKNNETNFIIGCEGIHKWKEGMTVFIGTQFWHRYKKTKGVKMAP